MTIPISDGVSVSQLKQTKDPRFKDLNPIAYDEFERVRAKLEQKLPQKNETISWKRAAFDQEQAKFIQKFLLA